MFTHGPFWFGRERQQRTWRTGEVLIYASLGFNMPSVVFNGCALLSLNQYYKKSRAMEVSNELAAEYTEV